MSDDEQLAAIRTKREAIIRGDAHSASDSVAGVARVIRAISVTPRMRRITITSEHFAELPDDLGWYRSFAAYFPKPGREDDIYVPSVQTDGMFSGVKPSAEASSALRVYTIRRFDRPSLELDIDFVLHESGGMGSAWAAAAAEGARMGFLINTWADPPHPDVDFLMFVGDETTIPHISNTLEALPAKRTAVVVIEVADAAEEQAIDSEADVTVVWAHRDDVPGTNDALLHALRDLTWPEGRVHVEVTGEARMISLVRTFLREERHLIRRGFGDPDPGPETSTYQVNAYWRKGRTAPEEVKHKDEYVYPRVASGVSFQDAMEEDLYSTPS